MGNYKPRTFEKGDQCMKEWVERSQFLLWFADTNGFMIPFFSEVLAIMPYLLRSLRIQKMFNAREVYARMDIMPKRMIWNWREARIIRIFMAVVVLFAAVFMTIGFLGANGKISANLPNYFALSSPMHNDGKMCKEQLSRDMDSTNAFLSSMTFIEYVMLCWALNA